MSHLLNNETVFFLSGFFRVSFVWGFPRHSVPRLSIHDVSHTFQAKSLAMEKITRESPKKRTVLETLPFFFKLIMFRSLISSSVVTKS